MSLSPESKPGESQSPALEIVPAIERQVETDLPASFRNLPETVRHEVLTKVSGVAISISHSSWNGDYPPPAVLEGYEKIEKGAADRILKMAEADLAHQHDMEKIAARYMFNGQYIGAALAGITLLGSIYLISGGYQLLGGLLGITIIVPLVALFVRGQFASRDPDANDDTKEPAEEKPKSKSGRPSGGATPPRRKKRR